jgi:tRNA pseudouridine32 synthase/23S rRNA pseudouridine746 synthase
MLTSMEEPRVLHVDPHLLVVDKPPGLLSVPGRGDGQQINLTVQLQRLYPDAQIVHRLDQATSGLMLFARGAAAQRNLSMAFEARQVHKVYVAVVHGWVQAEAGSIEAPLAADWPRRPRQVVDPAHGKPACTHWRVIGRSLGVGSGTTRLALEPITGRSHQLRVHLLSIGHPIVGDTLYAEDRLPHPRLLLHASQVRLLHPVHGQPLQFDSEPAF